MRLLGLFALLLLAPALPDTGTLIDDLELRRYYLEGGVEATVDEMEDLVDRYPEVYFVALAEELGGFATDTLADQLLDQLGEGTVVVLTPTEIGAVSTDHDEDQMDFALDQAASSQGSTYAQDFAEVAAGLSLDSPGVPSETNEAGFPWVPVVLGTGLVGGIGFVMWRSSRGRQAAQANLFEEARTEIRQQMDVLATQIVDLADDPGTDVNEAAQAHYRSASGTFQQAESRLAAATSLEQLEDLSDDLDRARWELDTTQALIDGKEPPPEPESEAVPAHCFFDPTHGTGRVEAEIQTATGSRKVMVCEADAEKLRQGEAPAPRQIPYDNQPVPAPRAPRTHGGLGMDWLDLFSIVVGGMGARRDYDWTGPRTSPRPGRSSNRSRGTASRGTRARSRTGR